MSDESLEFSPHNPRLPIWEPFEIDQDSLFIVSGDPGDAPNDLASLFYLLAANGAQVVLHGIGASVARIFRGTPVYPCECPTGDNWAFASRRTEEGLWHLWVRGWVLDLFR